MHAHVYSLYNQLFLDADIIATDVRIRVYNYITQSSLIKLKCMHARQFSSYRLAQYTAQCLHQLGSTGVRATGGKIHCCQCYR